MNTELPRFDTKMSDTEGLMWRLEKDPFLASTFGNITILDSRPNFEVFTRRMERTSMIIRRLRQRVQPAPANLGPPSWVDDPEFNIQYHVRYMALPAPGTMRQLLDLSTLLVLDAFDRSRPLWQFIVVDGLEGGRSALIQKLHHTITDGEGGVALSMQFLDVERHPPEPPPVIQMDGSPSESSATESAPNLMRTSMADAMRIPLGLLRQVRDVLSDPTQLPTLGVETAATVRNLISQIGDVDSARSPLWTQRSLKRRLEVLRAPYRPMLDASRALGGKINTAFITAAADAAGRYHRELGMPVESLRTSMAVSTRTEASGSNAFSLVRMLVPTGEMPIGERFAAINESVNQARESSKSATLATLAAVSGALPTSVITRIARTQSQTIDFATSNVRGAGVPLFIAGAQMLENYPVGPLGGVAFNLTMLSYNHSLDMGLNIDTAAVAQPERLRICMEQSLAEFLAIATPRATFAAPTLSAPSVWARIKTRWTRLRSR
ncbi:MAG: wax ester/triacylglycerol synthase domain-containing protein [Ilumatobacteraceae bacterium]